MTPIAASTYLFWRTGNAANFQFMFNFKISHFTERMNAFTKELLFDQEQIASLTRQLAHAEDEGSSALPDLVSPREKEQLIFRLKAKDLVLVWFDQDFKEQLTRSLQVYPLTEAEINHVLYDLCQFSLDKDKDDSQCKQIDFQKLPDKTADKADSYRIWHESLMITFNKLKDQYGNRIRQYLSSVLKPEQIQELLHASFANNIGSL